MKKKSILLVIMILCACLLAGCQCKHEWIAATCTSPKICSICNETEGEAIGHTWADASCSAPKTCTVCSETEGDSLPHTWVEANYQEPKSCSVCGAAEGKPLEADFEKYGLTINMNENKRYDKSNENEVSSSYFEPFSYVASCYDNSNYKTVAEAYVCDYRIFESDSKHPAKEGYEWRAFDLEITFFDENADKYGVSVNFRVEDYYAIEDWDNNQFDLVGTEWESFADTGLASMINYYGKEYPCLVSMEGEGFGNWYTTTMYNDENPSGIKCQKIDYHTSFYACVPVGYDGVVIGLIDSDSSNYLYEDINENTLLLRLDDTVSDRWD